MSVVIPTRDRGRLLLDAIASVFAAQSPPLEVIVADDGSTDGSVAAARRAYPQIHVVEGPFGNAARARNAGAAVARGEVLGFLDSDDLMASGKTSALVESLRKNLDLAFVHGTAEVIRADGTPDVAKTALRRGEFERGTRIGLDYSGLALFCAMFTSATAIRRASFEAIGGYDDTLDAYEDWDLYLRLSLIGQLAYVDDLAARYRVWSGNVPWDQTARWTARVATKHLHALPQISRSDRERARYGFERRLVQSYNVLGERHATRHAVMAAVRASPRRAALDMGLWRPLLRASTPTPLLRTIRRAPEDHL